MRRHLEWFQHHWRLRQPLVAPDQEIRQLLLDPHCTADEAAAGLVRYFWVTHQHALDRHGTLADYVGWPSIYGARNDAIEGVTRLAPLWAACVGTGFGTDEAREAMRSHLVRMFTAGCDPAHPGFWGPIGDRSTLICEAHDLALALWLSREQVFHRMPPATQQRIVSWLSQAVGRRTADNNWHLFVVMIDAVLAALVPGHRFSSEQRLERIWSFARPDGCFVDGPGGQVDFYNAWGFHYPLYFLSGIAPRYEGARSHDALAEFCHWYVWLFTEQGLPLFGRSLCYRLAAPTPVIACAVLRPDVVSPSVAASAFLSVWRFFIARGSLMCGRPTQGVFKDDIRWLDGYSGPSSSLWGVRSLVMWISAARNISQLSALPSSLPGHMSSIERYVAGLDARLVAQDGQSEIIFGGEDSLPKFPMRQNIRDRFRQLRYAVASRPDNNLLKLGVRRFSSDLSQYN